LSIDTISLCSATMRRAPSSIPSAVASERSAPEQKTLPVDPINTTRTASSAAAVSRCPNSSVTSCLDRALRLCGESRVMVATASRTS
jgi:hypothetical protein